MCHSNWLDARLLAFFEYTSYMSIKNHALYTFDSAYMLPTPLAEFLHDHDGETIVLATGVFDVLHQEHLHFLANARDSGDFLVVALESDVRVRALKGEGRPHFSQEERRQQLLDIDCADMVVILPENFSKPEHHEAVISQIQPAILAVSSHTNHQDKKQAILSKYGGEVLVVHQHQPGESTSELLGIAKDLNGLEGV